MATGRISTDGIARQISDVATDIDAEVNISGTVQVGGVGGTTTEPCHGFVHIVATGTATSDVDNAVAAVSTAAYIPGESAEA